MRLIDYIWALLGVFVGTGKWLYTQSWSPRNTTVMTQNLTDEERKRMIDLFKLEYEQATIRYENIYKAIWQNFSYLAVVSGGILAFGADAMPPLIAGSVACIPLIFWYLATFIPLNVYGDQTGARLANVERILNELGVKDIGNIDLIEKVTVSNRCGNWFGMMEKKRSSQPIMLNHYDNFERRHKKQNTDKIKYQQPSVRRRVHSFAGLLLVASIGLPIVHFIRSEDEKAPRIQLESAPVEVLVRDPEMQSVKRTLDSLVVKIDSMIHTDSSQTGN